ncbi:hypothetical protein [Roseomonas chloroacetimidivorans]|uniref:hypothetical protein n=1 Tax=Roseomonas chloroacetimidivorans TaxID=1766656 RepID=UPI003C72CDD2
MLLDDDFRSIRMEWRVSGNLRKSMGYMHVPIAGLAFLPLVFGLPLILGSLHIALL